MMNTASHRPFLRSRPQNPTGAILRFFGVVICSMLVLSFVVG